MSTNSEDQGANSGYVQTDEHVEFNVKAEEDLFSSALQNDETALHIVAAETKYPCLMLRIQRFGSLFKHYAKTHHLAENDLEFRYLEKVLQKTDTPKIIDFQNGATVLVRKRRKPELSEESVED